jgi:murein DD-endopeptidase MepM/ murein hydrolase activator NlpD
MASSKNLVAMALLLSGAVLIVSYLSTRGKTVNNPVPVKPKQVLSNTVVYPVAGLARWYIAAGFLQHFPDYPKDLLGRVQYHTGLDYNLKTGGDTDLGKPFVAMADGYVVEASRSNVGFGNLLVIEHPQFGTWSRYGHSNGFAKGLEKGDLVRAGEIIGYIGKSGTTFAHLHFDIMLEWRGARFWGATSLTTVKKVYADTLPWLKNHKAADVGDA